MLAQERQAMILEMLKQNDIVYTSDITRQFGVSNMTARRDLETLDKKCLLRRVHGGAVAIDHDNTVQRTLSHHVEQEAVRADLQAIGKIAASMANEGDTIFLGPGTTVLAMAHHLRQKSNITILTNSFPVVNELANTNKIIYFLGGILNGDEYSVTGTFANSMLKTFCANKAFIGCGGISPEHGITDFSAPTADVNRLMVKNAAQSILLCTSDKLRSDAFSIVCPLSELDTVIIDDSLQPQDADAIRSFGVNLRLVKVDEDDCND